MLLFRPLNDATERMRKVLNTLITGNRPMPEDQIGIVDSRMWDPKWRRQYARPYQGLVRGLNAGFGDYNKALTVASYESYSWGRGGTPSGVVKSFANMTPEQVYNRMGGWLQGLFQGQTIEEMVINFLNHVGEGPVNEVPVSYGLRVRGRLGDALEAAQVETALRATRPRNSTRSAIGKRRR